MKFPDLISAVRVHMGDHVGHPGGAGQKNVFRVGFHQKSLKFKNRPDGVQTFEFGGLLAEPFQVFSNHLEPFRIRIRCFGGCGLILTHELSYMAKDAAMGGGVNAKADKKQGKLLIAAEMGSQAIKEP